MQDAGQIPPASIIVRSGRGLWLVWLLHDPETGFPPKAFRNKQRLWIDLERAINHRFRHLGADHAVTDLVRLARVPGSIHSSTEQRVKYWIQKNSFGKDYTYTLEELADRFDVRRHVQKHVPAEHALHRTVESESTKANGPRASMAYRYLDFIDLWELRGGFKQGVRNNAALIYAFLLYVRRVPYDDAIVEVERLGAGCHPRLSVTECRNAVLSAYKRRPRTDWGPGRNCQPFRMSKQTMADRLDVTPDEADRLRKLPPASRFQAAGPKSTRARFGKKDRLALVLEVIADYGSVPSLRKIAELLYRRGVSVSPSTVKSYLQELDFSPGGGRGGRPTGQGTLFNLKEEPC